VATWITPQEARTEPYWPMCDVEGDDELETLLTSAQEQCELYAPALPDGSVPYRFRLAVVMQARALYRASIAGSGDQIGADGLTVTVFPMDWTVKNLLRPKRIGRVL
jgi:hypothetical protein